MSIVTQGSDANLDLDVGNGVSSSSDIKNGLYSGGTIDEFDVNELPKAAVEDNGQGMVNVQVFGVTGKSNTFSKIIEVVNNDSVPYNVGFAFTGFASFVGNGGKITTSDINSVFKFENGGDVISGVPDAEPGSGTDLSNISFSDLGIDNPLKVSGANTKQVDLKFNGSTSALTDHYNTAPGNFTNANNATDGSIASERQELVNEVTAVANPTSE